VYFSNLDFYHQFSKEKKLFIVLWRYYWKRRKKTIQKNILIFLKYLIQKRKSLEFST